MNHKNVVRRRRDGRSNRASPGKAILMAPVLLLPIAIAGYFLTDRAGPIDRLATLVSTPLEDSLSASSALYGNNARKKLCGGWRHLLVSGQKVRIVDIDTPELSPPRREEEQIKREQAKARLLALLNSGSFSLSTSLRDEDRYGRKRRAVTLGEVLIEDGLARRWQGAQSGWC